ncbi:MAG: SPFH domain-containing protein [Isosphaeraceae bacterium]|nr:SPFH domain-containing protein [Isosphaeraceae bacterium]
MGLRLEVLEFFDPTGRSLVQRIPAEGSADIKYGAQLIVQESQKALFVREGQVYDEFSAGRYTLSTANIPLITRILTIPWEKSPFTASVYFVGLQNFIDLKWGTKQPIPFRDKELSIVRLRSFGKFAIRVVEPRLLLSTLVGTSGLYTTDQVEDYLRDRIVSRLTDVLGTTLTSLFDLPALYDEIASAVRARTADDFRGFGLELTELMIGGISPPDEVQAMIDARSSMSAVGDMNAFLKFQAAKAMTQGGEGGDDGSGMMKAGLGAGLGMMMPGLIREAMNTPGSPAPAAVPPTAIPQSAPAHAPDAAAPSGSTAPKFCSQCGSKLGAGAKFCGECGARIA